MSSHGCVLPAQKIRGGKTLLRQGGGHTLATIFSGEPESKQLVLMRSSCVCCSKRFTWVDWCKAHGSPMECVTTLTSIYRKLRPREVK